MSAERLAGVTRQVVAVNRGELDDDRPLGAYLLSNAVGPPAFARERGAAALVPLLFGTDTGGGARTRSSSASRAERLAPGAPPGAYLGVTGTIPANDEQGDVIADHLHLLELATVLFVSIAAAAAQVASRELTPILVACGMAVTAGCLALLVAKLGFLRAFGRVWRSPS